MNPTKGPPRAAAHLPATSSGSVPAVTRAARLAGRWRRATAGGVWAAVHGRHGFRAEALLLHHHRCRHHVAVPVPSSAPPIPLALHLLHTRRPTEPRKKMSEALLSPKEMTDLTLGLPLPSARSPRNPRGGDNAIRFRSGRGLSDPAREAGDLSFKSKLSGKSYSQGCLLPCYSNYGAQRQPTCPAIGKMLRHHSQCYLQTI